MKKVWFDISNAPHVNLFEKIISELEKGGHEVIITCRPLSNTIDLLRLKDIQHEVVGVHYGKSIVKKILGYPIRVYQLYKFLKGKNIDLAVSQSSFHSPVVAWLLNKPSIYMNDNEHALGNIPSFIFAEKILLPEYFDLGKAKKQFAKSKKIVHYPGVKEGIYLCHSRVICRKESKNIFIRPEPWLAQYYQGDTEFLDNLIISLKDKYNVIILPRGDAQSVYFNKDIFSGITIQNKVLLLEDVADNCMLFIGAGGTMTREMAVLGVPTISVYQNDLLAVDKYLVSRNKMLHLPQLDVLDVEKFIKSKDSYFLDLELSEKGKETYKLIKKLILQL